MRACRHAVGGAFEPGDEDYVTVVYNDEVKF